MAAVSIYVLQIQVRTINYMEKELTKRGPYVIIDLVDCLKVIDDGFCVPFEWRVMSDDIVVCFHDFNVW